MGKTRRKVVRTITIEGPSDWVATVMAKCYVVNETKHLPIGGTVSSVVVSDEETEG